METIMNIARVLLIALLILFSSNSFSAQSKKSFIYQGSRSTVDFELESEKTHIEYRREYREQICYRPVYVGHRPYCYTRVVNYCSRDIYGRPYCRPVRRQFCESRPYYENQAYRCTKPTTVPVEVKDFDVLGKFTVNFSEVPDDITPNETFEMTLNAMNFNLEGQSGQELLIYQEVSSDISESDSLKEMDIVYNLSFKEMEKIVAPVTNGINEMRLEGRALKFNLGKIDESTPIKVHLAVVHPSRRGNYIVFNRELNDFEFTLEDNEYETSFNLDLDRILPGINLNIKHIFNISIKLDLDLENIVNKQDLPPLSINRYIEYPW